MRCCLIFAGGSSGIGKYTALELAKNGCKLAIVARRADALQETVTECVALGKISKDDVRLT